MTRRLLLPLMAGLILSAYFSPAAWANSYASGPPLDKIPAPTEILAFATDPPTPRPRQDMEPSRALPRAHFLRFLQHGYIESAPHALTGASDGSWCTGYFFTRDGTAYRWALSSRHLLSISTGARGCLIRLRDAEAKTIPAPLDYDTLPPLTNPPAEKDLYAYTTDLRPATGLAFPLSERNLRHFLRDGKLFTPPDRSALQDIADRQRLTLSPQLTKELARFFPPTDGPIPLSEYDLHCEGALATRDGHIYFWQLLGDTALELTSPAGEKCVLVLPQTNPIQAP